MGIYGQVEQRGLGGGEEGGNGEEGRGKGAGKEGMVRKGEAREQAKREWEIGEAGERGDGVECKLGDEEGN